MQDRGNTPGGVSTGGEVTLEESRELVKAVDEDTRVNVTLVMEGMEDGE